MNDDDPRELRLYTTTIPTEHRFPTLLSDHVYRLGLVWQNVAYNQPPHVGFFLGEGMQGWPGSRYIALHKLSHLLIRTIAMECGYNSASLAERIYSGDAEERRTGILIYTAVPDSEGTLGGLVSLADQDPSTGENRLARIVRMALYKAGRCSSDPLCGERLPQAPEDFLHGAACHSCLFVSETTCERGNRFLDRRFITPLAGDTEPLALIPDFK